MNYVYQLFALEGKTAIITGGTGVLGGEMAKALARCGVKVAVLGRNQENADRIVKEIREEGGEAIPLLANVVQKDSLEKARDTFFKSYKKLDILVNAAGGNMPGATITPEQTFFDLELQDFRKVMDLNLIGTVLPTQILASAMATQRSGVIINISSMAAQRALTRVVGYSASKAAIDNFTKWLAVEMAKKFGEGIRVNAIAPGFFIGEQNKSLLLNSDGTYTERGKTIIQHTPMGRFGEPSELIGTLIWLCSDASRFVTGTVIAVDGGFSAFSGV
ncbi:MAG: SDR family oxidoreductase [Cytophagales bacterium]|nr:SDR family oxidoreductase [Cytophagales bacterium]MDW8384328.1 SDR family oxidoreductase [Flammeovirgaceae bacterium]